MITVKTYHVQISFLDKESKTIINDYEDNATALTKAVEGLNEQEKENVIGTKITYIGDLH